MPQRKVNLADATQPELIEFAQSTLGIMIPGNAKRETALAKVMSAWPDKDYILLEAKEEQAPLSGQAPKPATAVQGGPPPGYVRIIVQRQEGAGGDDPIPLGVNGKIMLVERGKESDIKDAYFRVLENAVKHVYESLTDGGINPEARKVATYPYQVIAFGPKEQQAA